MLIPRENQWIRTNDLNRLHVVTSGDEDAPLVILLHGFPEFWYGWRYQIDALTEAGFRVWVPDQRGYNLSDKPRRIRDYSMETLVADVTGLIDAAGVERAHIVGHDIGGLVAWWLALLHPERVDRMAVLTTPHPQVLARHLRSNLEQMLRSWYIGSFQLPMLPELTFSLNNHELPAQILERTGGPGAFSQAEIAMYREAWAQPSAIGSMLNWFRAYTRHTPPKPASWEVTVPVMLLTGERDAFLSRAMDEPSIAHCPDGQLHTLPGVTHWLQHENPMDVNAYLTAWLTR